MEGMYRININHLHSWNDAVLLVEVMTFVIENEYNEKRNEELARIAEIYPGKKFPLTAVV